MLLGKRKTEKNCSENTLNISDCESILAKSKGGYSPAKYKNCIAFTRIDSAEEFEVSQLQDHES